MPHDKTPEQVDSMLATDRKFNELEIQPYLESHGLEDGYEWLVQFENSDHECDARGYLSYSYLRIVGKDWPK